MICTWTSASSCPRRRRCRAAAARRGTPGRGRGPRGGRGDPRLVGSKANHSPAHHSTQACDSPSTVEPDRRCGVRVQVARDVAGRDADGRAARPTVRWAMSWHTPARAAQASAAAVCTVGDARDVLHLVAQRTRTPPAPPRRAPGRPRPGARARRRPRAVPSSACPTRNSASRSRSSALAQRVPAGRAAASGPLGHLDQVLGGDDQRLVRRQHLEGRDGACPSSRGSRAARCAAARRVCDSSTVWPCWDSGVIRASLYDAMHRPAVAERRRVHHAQPAHSASPTQFGRGRARGSTGRGSRRWPPSRPAARVSICLGQLVEHLDQRAVLQAGADVADVPPRVVDRRPVRRRLAGWPGTPRPG